MYDLRNHGDSGSGEEEWITWGLNERNDVVLLQLNSSLVMKNTRMQILVC